MAHLIDKDALVAVEKFMYGANLEADIASTGECFNEKIAEAKYQLCKQIKDKINTLEVKEVDLEKEIDKWWWGKTWQTYGMAINPNDIRDFAKHFFELGMQQSKNYNNNEEIKEL